MPCAADVCQNVTAIDFQTVLCILSLQLRKAVIGGLKWRDFSRKLSLQPTMRVVKNPATINRIEKSAQNALSKLSINAAEFRHF